MTRRTLTLNPQILGNVSLLNLSQIALALYEYGIVSAQEFGWFNFEAKFITLQIQCFSPSVAPQFIGVAGERSSHPRRGSPCPGEQTRFLSRNRFSGLLRSEPIQIPPKCRFDSQSPRREALFE